MSKLDLKVQLEKKKFITHQKKIYPLNNRLKFLIYNFLIIAKMDLEACKILYEKKIYSASIYHLQQAAEKAVKTNALLTGEFTEKEIRNISHKGPRVLPLLMEKLAEFENYIETKVPGAKKTLLGGNELIKSTEKNVNFAKINYEMIRVMIEGVNRYKKKYLQEKKGKSEKEQIKILKAINYDMKIALLYTISFITFPHEAYTRYPDEELNPSDYTNDLGIVKATPELIKHLGACPSNT